jgi:hypothetical protein
MDPEGIEGIERTADQSPATQRPLSPWEVVVYVSTPE